MSDVLLQKSMKQGEVLSGLLDRASGLIPSSAKRHRVSWLQGSVVFDQDQLSPQNIVLNVPSGPSFEASRLLLVPEVRIRRTAVEVSDRTWRPTFWAWQSSGQWNEFRIRQAQIDAFAEMILQEKGRPQVALQTAPIPTQQLFSGTMRQAFLNDSFETAPGHVFDPCLELIPQSSLTVRVSPFFAAVAFGADNTPSETDSYEYRITAILEGEKVSR